MVDVMGHFGMALLWATIGWFFWEERVALTFVGLVLVTAMLPDVDLVLQGFLPIVHHGITHTILFVVAVGLVAGAIVEFVLRDWLERQFLKGEHYTVSEGALFAFTAGAFILGGFSHLFADMLSAPDIAAPVNPFWPLGKPWSVDIAWYNAWEWNIGLLALAIVVHLALGYLDVRFDHPYHIGRKV